jgi:hypothetical protein
VPDAHFAARGFTVLRYWNNEIDRNLEGVLMDIDRVVTERGGPGGGPPGGGGGGPRFALPTL